MKYRILYTRAYNRKAAKFLKRHPELEKQYQKTLQLVEINPFHPSLHFHRLKGILSKLHSVTINRQYRIVIHFIIDKKNIIPVDVGSHDDVY